MYPETEGNNLKVGVMQKWKMLLIIIPGLMSGAGWIENHWSS
jgi:hypothetical protein